LIEAGLLRNKKVLSNNKKTVGVIQNVLFEADPTNPTAYILIFMAQKNWLSKYVQDNLGSIGIKTLTSLLPDESSSILEDLKNKGEEETLKVWRSYLENKSKRDLSSLKCYLLPSSFLEESSCSEKEAMLKTDEKDLVDYVSVGIPSFAKDSENMFAFYQESLVGNQDCVLPVTLNKTPLHLKTLSDEKHSKGLIADVELDISKGQVANLVVNVVSGENVGKRLVPISQIDFDTQTIVEGKNFSVCSPIEH
jgi:sporulation protein YlmC with PRC-barrel domain